MGLVRALQFLADNSLHVATLVTDRHIQIAKYMAEVKLDIEHLYVSKCITFNFIMKLTNTT